MPARRPLVLISGRKKELPVGDTIAWPLLSSVPQYVAAWGAIDPTTKAEDSGVLHLAGNEIVTGQKTFDSDLVVSGSGRMFRADFSSAAATRTKIQTSTTGGATNVTLIPNALLQQSIITLFNSSDAGNASGAQFAANLAECQFNSVATGSAVLFPWSFKINNALFLRVDLDGTVRGGADNEQTLGRTDLRWKEVWVASGVISPSDAREKTPVRAFTPSEIAAAIELGGEIGAYQWLGMIEAKGAAARQHIGMTVQRAIEILRSHGLDPFAYGFICYDQWDELPEIRYEWGALPQVVDDFGNLLQEAQEAGFEIVQEHRPAGDRYSFRMDELLAFIARGLVHRLDSVEQALGLGA